MNGRSQEAVHTGLARSHLTLVERELSQFLEHERERIESYAPQAAALVREMARVVGAGGKRLRPLFCFWGYRAGGGGNREVVARAAAAVELLHTSAIIHDDLIDRSPLRRGQPATFRALAGDGAGSRRFGRSAAILAGDLAQALSDQLLLECGAPAGRISAAFGAFNRMRMEAVSGEFLDLLQARGGPPNEEEARRTAALKSGSYTVVGPLLLGAALAGAPGAVSSALERFGRPLGEAFQLRDDVLGTFGDEALTGKDRDADIREGKRTVLVAKALDLGTAQDRRLIAERLGRHGQSPEDVAEVRSVLASSGALAQTIALVDSLAAQAKAELADPLLPADVRQGLGALADRVASRDE